MTINEIKKEITTQLRADIEDDQRGISIHHKVRAILELYRDKQITKRFFDKFTQVTGLNCARYNRCGLNSIRVWGGAIPETKPVECFLGYDSDMGSYQPEVFEDRDACHAQPAIDRNTRRLGMLNDSVYLDRISTAVFNYLQASAALKELMGDSFHNEAFYIIKRIAKL